MVEHLGTQKSFRFSTDELKLLDELARQHGGQKAAVMAGLRALHGRGTVSDEELLALIGKRLRRR